jgi:hypothetical protein
VTEIRPWHLSAFGIHHPPDNEFRGIHQVKPQKWSLITITGRVFSAGQECEWSCGFILNNRTGIEKNPQKEKYHLFYPDNITV